MRLSTRDLFVLLAFVATIAWCAGKVGYDSPLFWLSAIVSLFLAGAFVRWTAPERRGTAALVAGLPFVGFFTLCIGTIATLIVSVLLVIATITLAFFPPASLNVRVRLAMLCVSAAFIYAYVYGAGDVRRILAARRQFPLESIDKRLDYEAPLAATPSAVTNAPLVLAKLDRDEQDYGQYGWRGQQLRRIHNHEYERFIRANGFGVTRMPRPRVESIASRPLRDIAFDDLSNPNADAYDWRAGREGVARGTIHSAHERSRRDFLDPEGFGYIRTPRIEVAGFIQHAFHHHPMAGDPLQSKWRLQRLELVSLLKFDEPRVYVLDHLPRMDQLSNETAPTRELNEFESSALAKLRCDEDIVVKRAGANVQMLGSLRAAKQCLECHNVQRGELLGAFCYQLTLIDEGDEPAEQELAASED